MSPLRGLRWFREFPLRTPFFPFGEGLDPPPDLDVGRGEVSDDTFSLKTVQGTPRRAQDELQDGSR